MQQWTRRGSVAAVLVGLVAASGCATTSFTSTWRAPDAVAGSIAGKKVAAMVVSPNDAVRRAAEDTLARELTARGAQGVPSYTLFEGRNHKDKDAVKARMEQAGLDAVVVLRAVGKDKELTYTPGMYSTMPMYGSFWGGYYGFGWGAVYDPGYLTTNTIYTVETLVYSLRQDKLIWAGTSETTNPSKVDSFVRELAGKVVDQMTKEGLLR
jgi:hypothetical protein